MIRAFGLGDIPLLRRYRNESIFLESIPTLTWGPTLASARAALSPVAAAAGIFTSVCLDEENPGAPLIGQVAHALGSPLARLAFLAPDTATESPALHVLLEELTKKVGERGAQSIIAEVEESSPAFEALRHAGFSVYARQRIWRISEFKPAEELQNTWRKIGSQDEFAVHTLYSSLVPALVQQVEPAPTDRQRGLVLCFDGEPMAYAMLAHGPRGVWVQPFVHPQMEQVELQMGNLLGELTPRRARPVYVSVRSYQAGLNPILEDLDAEACPRQALLVKRLAMTQKANELFKLPAIEGGRAEITTPISPPLIESGNETVMVQYDKAPNYR